MKIATIKGPLGVGVDSFRMVSSMRIARANPPFFNEKKPINMGDWFMTNTIDRILNWKDLLIIYLNQENIDWNYINKECDAVILRGGNYINGGWLSRVYSKKMLSKIKIPIILFGAGLQSSIHGKVELTKEDIDILKFISGSCNSFSVRGEDTAKVLRDIGIENSVVTGCPTLFRSLKPRIKIRNPTNERALFSFRQGLYTHDFGPYKKQLQAIRILRKKFKSIRVVLQGEETALQNYFQYKHWGSRYHDKLIPIPGTNIKKLEREYMDINKIKKDIHLLFDCLSDRFFVDWFMNNTFFSYDVQNYFDKFKSASIMVGCRLHSNLLSLANGTPAFFLTYDGRTQEIVDLFKIPHCKLEDFNKNINILDCNWKDFENKYSYYYNEMYKFLESNNLKHNLKMSF